MNWWPLIFVSQGLDRYLLHADGFQGLIEYHVPVVDGLAKEITPLAWRDWSLVRMLMPVGLPGLKEIMEESGGKSAKGIKEVLLL